MPIGAALESKLRSHVQERRAHLLEIVADLVRIPSENTPPRGSERPCQEHVERFLRGQGLDPKLYDLTAVPGLEKHALYWPGRDYAHRPNVGALRMGRGKGRSLLLSGHIDTVPRGTQSWTRDPFGGEIDGNRLYGRGSVDMKAGVGMNLFIFEALRVLGIELQGDLLFETVIDEEFGGVNGTLAGRLMGFNADAAVISEPSFLRVCPAQRGGRTVHIKLSSAGGVLTQGETPSGVIDQLRFILSSLAAFTEQRRRRALSHESYAAAADPVPVSITKVFTSPWGTQEPITVPETCQIEMYWQLMPGETQEAVDREFFAWFDGMIATAPKVFPSRPQIEFPIRWMPGSAISKSEPLVRELAACATKVLGKEPPIEGIEGPCDMYVFHQAFGTPAVLWGPRGSNVHAADEYVEIDSLLQATQTLLAFVSSWCGVV